MLLNRVVFSLLMVIVATTNASEVNVTKGAQSVTILQYHHVSADTPASTSITPAQFEIHLAFMQKHNYRVIALSEAIEKIKQKEPLPLNSVVITFDDAYSNIYHNAFPLLKKYQYPFTVFVNTQPLDDRYSTHASWQQIQEMVAGGGAMANHGVSHGHLLYRPKGESIEQWRLRVSADIEQAQQRLTQMVGVTDRFFAYPYGEFNESLKQVVAELNYVGFGQQSGAVSYDSDMLALPRFPVSGVYSQLDELKQKLRTLPWPINRIDGPENPVLVSQQPPVVLLTLSAKPRHWRQVNCFATGQGAIHSEWVEDSTVLRVQANKPLKFGRSRYNCTMPASEAGVFYWISLPWISLNQHGEWLRD